MTIIDMPIMEYINLCKDKARENGYLWFMVLLAREADMPLGYEKLKRDWNSLHDLTNKYILFLLTKANKPHKHIDRLILSENSYEGIGNSNLLIINNHGFTVSSWYFQSKFEKMCREEALRNTSLHITEVLRAFDLGEEDMPSLLLYPLENYEHSQRIIIPIHDNNIYHAIKSFILYLQPLLKEYDECENKIDEIYMHINDKSAIEIENKITKAESSFIRTEEYLNKLIPPTSKDYEIVQNAIIKGDLQVSNGYEYPLKGIIRNIIKITKRDAGINERIQEKKVKSQEIERETKVLEKVLFSKMEELDNIKDQIYKKANSFSISTVKNSLSKAGIIKKGGDNIITLPNFKIGVTFCGEYREKYVRPFCEALIKNNGFSKDEIFLDVWHDYLFNGVNGAEILKRIYNEKCELVVVLLSPNYKDKKWTKYVEWPAIEALINNGLGRKICLLRVDNADMGDLSGLYEGVAIPKDIDRLNPDQVAEFIYKVYNNRCLQLIPPPDQAITATDIPDIESKKEAQKGKAISDSKWKYKVLIMDDNPEPLTILNKVLSKTFSSAVPYSVSVDTATTPIEVLHKNMETDYDVFILDVARNPELSAQIDQVQYFGKSMVERMIAEKPNAKIEAKFYIYSKLEQEIIWNEFKGLDNNLNIEYIQKSSKSASDVATMIKEYLDYNYFMNSRYSFGI